MSCHSVYFCFYVNNNETLHHLLAVIVDSVFKNSVISFWFQKACSMTGIGNVKVCIGFKYYL